MNSLHHQPDDGNSLFLVKSVSIPDNFQQMVPADPTEHSKNRHYQNNKK